MDKEELIFKYAEAGARYNHMLILTALDRHTAALRRLRLHFYRFVPREYTQQPYPASDRRPGVPIPDTIPGILNLQTCDFEDVPDPRKQKKEFWLMEEKMTLELAIRIIKARKEEAELSVERHKTHSFEFMKGLAMGSYDAYKNVLELLEEIKEN